MIREFLLSEIGSLWIPTQYGVQISICWHCERCIYDPNGSGIQILGIKSRDPFSGLTDMSAYNIILNEFSNLFSVLLYDVRNPR